MAKDLSTTSSADILDLRGLVDSSLKVIDSAGREWPIAPDIPLRTALTMLHYAQDLDNSINSGSMEAEAFNACIDAVLAVLRRSTPTATRDEVIDAFSVADLLRLLLWLSLRLRASVESPNGETPALNSASEMTAAAATPQRTRSPRKSRPARS